MICSVRVALLRKRIQSSKDYQVLNIINTLEKNKNEK